MTKRCVLMLLATSCLIFGCDAGCQASTVNVGRADILVVLVDSGTGENAGTIVSDQYGNVSVPCGQMVGINQTV